MNRSGIIFYDVFRCEREWWRFIHINLFVCDAIFAPHFFFAVSHVAQFNEIMECHEVDCQFFCRQNTRKIHMNRLMMVPLCWAPSAAFWKFLWRKNAIMEVSYDKNNSIMLPAIVYEGREGKIETRLEIVTVWTGWHYLSWSLSRLQMIWNYLTEKLKFYF